MKVTLKDGVYLDRTGNYFTVEFGYMSGQIGVKVSGIDENGVEVERVMHVHEETFRGLLTLAGESEHLGEL